MADISLTDYVYFVYLDDVEGMSIEESLTVQEALDDWYGDCNIIPSNDCKVVAAHIKHKRDLLDSIGGKNADIDSLMKYLVRETGYKIAG